MKIKLIPKNVLDVSNLLTLVEENRNLFFVYLEYNEYEGKNDFCNVALTPLTPLYHITKWLKGESELIEVIEEGKNE